MRYVIGADVWEGNLDIDEGMLKDAGIEFLIVRLNSMSGGHHKDDNFDLQWAQAEPFIRWPYFVYNPWVSGKDNFDWLNANMPSDAKAVGIDIEVKKDGYSPDEYASNVIQFLALAKKWNYNLYTGEWFRSYLSQWPSDCEYWWGRYPFVVYPKEKTRISWANLMPMVQSLVWAPGNPPGRCRLWQCTADRYVLPGCNNRPIDINIWNDTRDALMKWAGGVKQLSWKQAITAWSRTKGYTGPDPETV